MSTAEEILNKHYYTRQDPECDMEGLIKIINEARIEAIKECADDLQKLRNQYEVINSNYVVSVYPIDHLIESFESKIDQIK